MFWDLAFGPEEITLLGGLGVEFPTALGYDEGRDTSFTIFVDDHAGASGNFEA